VPRITVTPLRALEEARWDWRDTAPKWREPVSGYTLATFDPFPAYPHDAQTVQAAVDAAASAWAPSWDITVHVADREDTGRTSGFAHLYEGGRYDGDDWTETEPHGVIVLAGKRIPPHPAVTAYLVGHELGHHAEWAINRANGAKHACSSTLAAEYVKVRGLNPDSLRHGDGGRWHTSVHEILACDFRVLVCGLEPAYWPHPGVPRPEAVPGLAGWWDEAQEKVHGF
jgi:hypothetical protein